MERAEQWPSSSRSEQVTRDVACLQSDAYTSEQFPNLQIELANAE